MSALTVATLWWSSSSFGLGLGPGDLKIQSHLVSLLKASVTLRGLDGIDLDPEFFSIQIESDSTSKIEFRLQRMDADTAVIDLYTREIVSNPLFQFRIEVKWDNIEVLRNYDVLVDPPVYQEFLLSDEGSETGEAIISDAGQTGEQNDLQVQKPIAISDTESGELGLLTLKFRHVGSPDSMMVQCQMVHILGNGLGLSAQFTDLSKRGQVMLGMMLASGRAQIDEQVEEEMA